MISISIPGWRNVEIENIVLDLNGTIATDGKIDPASKEKINLLAKKVKVYVLTADTHGTASEEMKELEAELIEIPEEDSKNRKSLFLRSLNPDQTVAVGNGSNDQLILKEARLGIAILGDEGMSVLAAKHADIIVKNISDALDLFLKPKRLIATLRQ